MTTSLRHLLAELRASRRETVAALAGAPDERMHHENQWAGGPMDVRFLLLRFADHDEEHGLSIAATLAELGFRPTRAQRILAAAEATHGELHGALVGLTDADLDLAPPGEWPLRRTLAHLTRAEERYTITTRWSADRFLSGEPFDWPDDILPSSEALPLDGTLADIVARIDAAREQAIATLADLPDAALPAPTRWAERDVTVEFRLGRFAHHEREHTAHVLKWRRQTGRARTEAQELLALGWHARGVLEGWLVGVPDALLDTAPADGGWTVRRSLEHLVTVDRFLRGRIEGAASPEVTV